MVGSSLPSYTSLTKFLDEKDEPTTDPELQTRKVKNRTWIGIEHKSFWLGIVIMIAGLLLFAVQRSCQLSSTDVGRLFDTYVQSWNTRDMRKVSSLWTENGEIQSANGTKLQGTSNIETYLTRKRNESQALVGIQRSDPQNMAESTVVRGNAEYAVCGEHGSVLVFEPFTAILTRHSGELKIALWIDEKRP